MRSPTVSPYSAAFLGEDVDPEAITDDDDGRREDSLVGGDHGDSSSVDCMHGSFGSSLSLHGVRVDESSVLDNCSRPSSPFDILTAQDVLPIEMARSRFLNLIVDHFIGEHVIERVECSASDCSQANDKSNKRKQHEVHYEGDPLFALPLMYIANLYETLVSDVNVRLASLTGFREKTIGLALEASGGLYRKLTQKFPKKGTCSFRRRELATSRSTRTKFPELVVHEEKRVRFVVINGLEIVERPNNMGVEDADWFKRLTGRSEVAVSSRDFKFYSPRHKFRHSPQPGFDIPGTSAIPEDENSPLVCSSGFRPPNEIQNQHQSTSKRHIEQLENQPYLHLFHQAEGDTVQQHSAQFPPIHQCTCAPHMSDNLHHQQQSYLSPHVPCLQTGQVYLGGRMNILVSILLHLALTKSHMVYNFSTITSQRPCWLGSVNQASLHLSQLKNGAKDLNTSSIVLNPHVVASKCLETPVDCSRLSMLFPATFLFVSLMMSSLFQPTSPAKFCDECGSPYLRATSKFCSECGTKRIGI
ncbi:hypothetical protein EJB05_42225 [Eragrostis curvula]|uniref:Zinc-ribbon domain-containing protein n=1 Tax=Eragrostis curvula TaxID=38414 RepID=A0A5J9TBP0_9POAL|nr:hypothetical protein EJB05_42225 [Eragrostis curvula]